MLSPSFSSHMNNKIRHSITARYSRQLLTLSVAAGLFGLLEGCAGTFPNKFTRVSPSAPAEPATPTEFATAPAPVTEEELPENANSRKKQARSARAPAQEAAAPRKLYEWRGDGRRVSRIVVDTNAQKAVFYDGNEEVGWSTVATGLADYPTPTGEFEVIEKIADKTSNLYGRIYNKAGVVVKNNAKLGRDPIPPGGRFVGASMPNFLRMTFDGVGMHAGPLPRPGSPASHGCIRLPEKVADNLYRHVGVGTKISVVGGGPSYGNYAARIRQERLAAEARRAEARRAAALAAATTARELDPLEAEMELISRDKATEETGVRIAANVVPPAVPSESAPRHSTSVGDKPTSAVQAEAPRASTAPAVTATVPAPIVPAVNAAAMPRANPAPTVTTPPVSTAPAAVTTTVPAPTVPAANAAAMPRANPAPVTTPPASTSTTSTPAPPASAP